MATGTRGWAGQTLQSITITNSGGGTPILLGVTARALVPVPEASTTVSLGLLLALGGLVIASKRRKTGAKTDVKTTA